VSKSKKMLPPREWVQLKAAFLQIMSITGTRNSALIGINQDLCNGQLRSKLVEPDGKEALLDSSDWQQRTVRAVGNPEEGVWVEPHVDGHLYYVRAVDLYERYKPTMTAAPQSDDTRPPERRRGPVLKHEWHAIDGEIARRCINPKTRLLEIPKNERKLAADLLDWCQEKYEKEPAESEMRDAVKAICAALRVAYK
jgi:hypothetical protein